jgi:DNA polymerase III sliding clamp (beta) subunit (PCNA family)
MSAKTMQVVITKADLDAVVARASLAAMSDEGQSEMQRASNETRGCVRVAAAGGKITFESSVSRFSARHVVPAGGEVEIVSEGETCVPAKDLKIVASKVRSGRKVSITFIPSPPDPTLAVSPEAKAILPNGVVEVGSINGDRVVTKTKIEAYPTVGFSAPQYPDESELTVLMSGKASAVRTACGAVGFCINPDDQKETYDKYAIFTAPDAIYFLGADGRRAAVVQAKAEAFDRIIGTDSKVPVLVDALFMTPIVASLSDDDPVTIAVDKDAQRLFIISGRTTYHVAMIAEKLRMKYPHYKRVVDLEAGMVMLVNREELAEASDMLYVVNQDRGRHTICRDEKVVRVVSKGLTSIKEASGQVPCAFVGEGKMRAETISLATKYLVDGLKKMGSDNVRMSFTPDELRVKIEDESDPKFTYYLQVMSPNDV